MSDKILPGERAANLTLPMLGGGKDWSLHAADPENFTLLVFYRGRHCPLCQKQLEELNERASEFGDKGVEVIALSCDDEAAAAKTGKDWQIDKLSVLHGLSVDEARHWGLYISPAINDKEPALFCEPGLFLLRPDNTVFSAWIQSVPFARPTLDSILETVDFVLDKNYPPRGTATEQQIKSAA